ncbi:MAG: TSUP family transporter [Hyphomicrobiales bacterium]|nr:TSUP family transporter [Hyphomicrobiales bacterium]MDE2017564.1 TSUP family transporter [Hyphomicrobiales bacterium]
MTALSPAAIAALAAAAFVAATLDAFAGGGGLITVPALALAGLDPVATVATNKLGGVFGSGSASYSFARAGKVDFAGTAPFAVASGLGALAGALCLPYAPVDAMRAALPALLVAVAAYFVFGPAPSHHDHVRSLARERLGVAGAGLVGFYDGVFGPGAGSFFAILFLGYLGRALMGGIGSGRLCNFASNFGALCVFALGGHIAWVAGLAMGAAQFAGARIGARIALGGGAKFVRPAIAVASCLMAAKLALEPSNPIRAWIMR